MGEHRRKHRALHAQFQGKEKDRGEDDVGHRPDQDGRHAHFGKTPPCDEGIRAEDELHEDRPDRTKAHVFPFQVIFFFAGTRSNPCRCGVPPPSRHGPLLCRFP